MTNQTDGAAPIISQSVHDGGLGLVIESMPSVKTCSMTLHLPGGASAEPEGAAGEGASTLLAELLQRGAGGRTAREFAAAVDRLGASVNSDCSPMSLSISAACLAECAKPVLDLVMDVAQSPVIADEEVEPVRALALQEIASIKDAPARVASLELRRVLFPPPLNRTAMGDVDGLRRWDGASLRDWWRATSGPSGATLSLAGGVRAEEVRGWVDGRMGTWQGACRVTESAGPALGTNSHIAHPGAQTVIMLGSGGITANDPDLLALRLLMHVIGGSSSSRLFTEVRERRGLCYGVGTEVIALVRIGALLVSASSTPDRAGDTLAVTLEQLRLAGRGISREEFERAVVGFKSAIVFSGESSRSRASAILGDVLRGAAPRSLETIAREVDALTLDGVNEVAARRLGERWVQSLVRVTVGPSEPGSKG